MTLPDDVQITAEDVLPRRRDLPPHLVTRPGQIAPANVEEINAWRRAHGMRPWAKTDWPRWDTLLALCVIAAVIIGAVVLVMVLRKP